MTSVFWLDLILYLVLYAFLGWLVEVTCCAVVRRRFYNRGLLSMPLILSYGVTFVLLILILPTLNSHLLRYLATLAVASVVESLAALATHRATPGIQWAEEREQLFAANWRGLLFSAGAAGAYYLVYLVCQPLLMAGLLLIPSPVKLAFAIAVLVLMAIDFITCLAALRGGRPEDYRQYQEKSGWRRLVAWQTAVIWRRFERAYPGIQTGTAQEETEYTFAKGLCLDKLIWIFLVCGLLGDLVETLYCAFIWREWMSRSSVLYGPISFVWGLGGVLLTVLLLQLEGRHDRYVFLGGFFIGGVFEYACSVFTELVFGTVFWDYSHLPLNIGGRTNLLFCLFWGVVAVVWVKVIYPPMSRLIEKLPAIAGKVLTWVLVLFLVCDAALTVSAMVRYNQRAQGVPSSNPFEEFLDRQYGDDLIAHRWPNMVEAE